MLLSDFLFIFSLFLAFLHSQSQTLCSHPSERSDYEIRGSPTHPDRHLQAAFVPRLSNLLTFVSVQREPLQGSVPNVPDGQRPVCPNLDDSQHGGHQGAHHRHGPHPGRVEM